ncbi:phosphoribosylamine--glycine ligase [Emticicia sp. BO119]|uniref:phosphoribosylamine--glycine ligase n=1 Tax=Emticicia sp. BO119 TaxID=2757768 RepID=UPI0015F03E6E|nr:phosphoribosylamine--glycine ligase [Emticicia sp. BO119]MBA4850985.1 phosphoribosylamine--glycine ligase [Emticicia sp. BO119]
MNILIIGSGGREHAFAWKISQSKNLTQLFVAPGNAGTAQLATNLPIAVSDFTGIAQAVKEHNIEMIIVGPEDPLVKGIVDFFKKDKSLKKVKIVGPDAAGAQLEGSKDFSKNFMQKYGIPTAASQTFTKDTLDEGLAYLEKQSLPIVLKADGLAAGKGVIIAETLAEAKQSLHEMLAEAKFGDASSKVLIEQYLSGIELSVFVLSDGKNYKILPEAKDYKRIGDGDKGLNTGGMGAVSPVPFANEAFLQKVEERVVKPTLAGLQTEGIKYVGFIFVGLMNVGGEPYVIEYNARMGDPETEVVLPRIKTDMVKLMKATAEGKLDKIKLSLNPKVAIATVVVAGGYPEDYRKGDLMIIPKAEKDTIIFHAGTKLAGDKIVLTNGGRVIVSVAMARTLNSARQKSQRLAKNIIFDGRYYRKDIGKDLLKFLKEQE